MFIHTARPRLLGCQSLKEPRRCADPHWRSGGGRGGPPLIAPLAAEVVNEWAPPPRPVYPIAFLRISSTIIGAASHVQACGAQDLRAGPWRSGPNLGSRAVVVWEAAEPGGGSVGVAPSLSTGGCRPSRAGKGQRGGSF